MKAAERALAPHASQSLKDGWMLPFHLLFEEPPPVKKRSFYSTVGKDTVAE